MNTEMSVPLLFTQLVIAEREGREGGDDGKASSSLTVHTCVLDEDYSIWKE